jgi:anti-sigma B factor antagonist/stage II sporulation protein AA (anti-sigma F factor antagonist)
MESTLAIESKDVEGVRVVALNGRLDAVTAPSAEQQVGAMVDDSHHRFLLDFRALEYLSSAGMRMLLALTKQLRAVKGRLVLCNVNDNVMDVFKMSGFDHLLEIVEDEAKGLARFQ